MKRALSFFVICALAVFFAVIQGGYFTRGEVAESLSSAGETEEAGENVDTPVNGIADGESSGGSNSAASNVEQSLQAFLLFEQESLGLVDELNELNLADRNARLDEYLEDVEYFERDGRFMASEAMILKIQALKLRQLEPHLLEEQSLAIGEGYRVRTEQAQKFLKENPSEELVSYKSEAQRILQEVAAMPDGAFGDGLSRDEYLRVKLQEARVKIYSTDDE